MWKSLSAQREESWKPVDALGLGCVGLTAIESRNDALRLLDYAYDVGIRHFDTARVYGMGMSEEILGAFLKGRRNSVTVTTKFGITPPSFVKKVPFPNRIKKMLKKIPFADRRIRKAVSSRSSMNNFNPAAAQRSLEESLKALGTDHVDIWLLHEAGIEETRNAELLEFLESRKAAGQIHQIGIGSAFSKLGGDCTLIPTQIEVVQFENSVVQPNLDSLANCTQKSLITHSAIKHAGEIRGLLTRRENHIANFRKTFGFDLAQIEDLSGLLLAWAVQNNTLGRVLFGSTSLEHVRRNVSIFDDERMSPDAIAKFHKLLDMTLHRIRKTGSAANRDSGAEFNAGD
jgi:aryl-alcohol dehydrogenase-like predicted oxidoreductase